MAKDWLEAANSDQNEVVKLKQQLAAETAKREQLEEKLELFLQRIEANEGTDLRPLRKEMAEEETPVAAEPVEVETPKRRGRPRKQ